MRIQLFVLFLAVFGSTELPLTHGSLIKSIEFGWRKFWQFSCSYSSVLLSPRSGRAEGSEAAAAEVEPEVDLRDEDSLFQWLYPNANKSREEYVRLKEANEGRSLRSWTDFMMDLWQRECFKREKEARSEDAPPETTGRSAWVTGNGTKVGAIIQAVYNATPPSISKQQNKFFSAYGGDIEYFYPLIGFAIPFDGEITLLGFHGFKGIFPYK